MKNALIIFKKELKRFFTDRRMLLSMFLPGILIFVMYTLMGKLMTGNVFNSAPHDVTYRIAYTDNYAADKTNEPKLLTFIDGYVATEKNNETDAHSFSSADLSTYLEKLKNKELDLIISYTDNFEDKLDDSTAKNAINLYYNGEIEASESLYGVTSGLIGTCYNNYQINFDYANNTPIKADVGENNAMLAKIMGFIIPMVTVSLLYSTVISICPESISGEKERGTLASLLLTPMKRSEFVIGKVSALSIVAILSGAASFLGLIMSLPGLFGGASLPINPGQMILLFIILVTTLLLFISFGVLISSLANTVKEAGSYLGPLIAIFMTLSIIASILNFTNPAFAAIPIMNLSMCISAIMAQSSNITILFLITSISNLVFAGAFIFLVTKLFNKERIVLGQ